MLTRAMGCSDTALNVSEEIIRDSLASHRVSLNRERAMCPRDGCAVVFFCVFPEVLILQNCTDGLIPPAFGWMFCVTNSRTAGAPGWLRSSRALAGTGGVPSQPGLGSASSGHGGWAEHPGEGPAAAGDRQVSGSLKDTSPMFAGRS